MAEQQLYKFKAHANRKLHVGSVMVKQADGRFEEMTVKFDDGVVRVRSHVAEALRNDGRYGHEYVEVPDDSAIDRPKQAALGPKVTSPAPSTDKSLAERVMEGRPPQNTGAPKGDMDAFFSDEEKSDVEPGESTHLRVPPPSQGDEPT